MGVRSTSPPADGGERTPACSPASTMSSAPPRRTGDGPLLIVAGAGTGKTATLVHRVA